MTKENETDLKSYKISLKNIKIIVISAYFDPFHCPTDENWTQNNNTENEKKKLPIQVQL